MQVSKLSVSNGRVTGTCSSGKPVQHNSPSWPCPNGTSGGMSVPSGVMGVLMHTMVGDLPGTVQIFNEVSFQASAHFGVDQAGNIHQFGPVNGWKAWHCVEGNGHWYGIEFADHGSPANPLTPAQIAAGAQLLELLSRPTVGNFPMQITNSTGTEGFGVHRMGGLAFGGHSCPQLGNGSGPRSGQREDIIRIGEQIRAGKPPAPAFRTWTSAGQMTLAALCKAELNELPSTVLRVTVENSPGKVFAPALAQYINAVMAADTEPCPAGVTWIYPGGEWLTQGQMSLAALCRAQLGVLPAVVLQLTAERSRDAAFPPPAADYINAVMARTLLKPAAGVVLHY